MTGAANKWYIKYKNTEEHKTDSFKTFLNKLKEQFSKGYDTQELYNKFMRIKQTAKVDAFNKKFRQISDEIPDNTFTEEFLLLMYISKLKFNIQKEVRYRNPENLAEAMRIALICDNYNKSTATWKNG